MRESIVFDRVTKRYRQGEVSVDALRDASFSIAEGEFVVIFGPSGAGKSTVLNILGGIDRASSGRVLVDGEAIGGLNEAQLAAYRRTKIGFVFQYYNLIANLSVWENIAFACEGIADARTPDEMLALLGLEDKARRFRPSYRAAAATRRDRAPWRRSRAACSAMSRPAPSMRRRGVRSLQCSRTSTAGRVCTVVLITHNPELQRMADRVIHVHSGRIARVELNGARRPIRDLVLA